LLSTDHPVSINYMVLVDNAPSRLSSFTERIGGAAVHLAQRRQGVDLSGRLGGLELGTGRLSRNDLDVVATEVARVPQAWRHLVGPAPKTRQRIVLHRQENFEVLLLLWAPHEPSDWHDHGGSAGGFAVVAGSLHERYRRSDADDRVTSRVLPTGSHGSFAATHLHDVVPVVGAPAVSVHSYSPPLSSLVYYDQTPFGFVAREVVPED
jgi:hypothetical protein